MTLEKRQQSPGSVRSLADRLCRALQRNRVAYRRPSCSGGTAASPSAWDLLPNQQSRPRRRSGLAHLRHALLPLLILASSASALINPTFTPVELVNGSSVILTCRLHLETNGTVSVESAVCIKGRFATPLSLTASRVVRETLAAVSTTNGIDAVVFMNDRPSAAEATNPATATQAGSVLTAAGWAAIRRMDETAGVLTEDSADMKAVWNGSPEMLASIARDAIAHGNAVSIPATAGVSWETVRETGRISGHVNGCQPVTVNGRILIFMPCDKGDRLYAQDRDGTLADITAGVGLLTRSDHALWGDLDGDRVPDLVSVAGRSLSIHLGGTNRLGQAVDSLDLDDACSSLAFIGDADSPSGAVVAAGAQGPVLVDLQSGRLAATALRHPAEPGASAAAGPCLAADFDNDGRGDILQFLETGCRLWRGRGRREFAARPAMPMNGVGRVRCAAVGDYNSDGRLDVLVAGENGLELLRNRDTPDNFESFIAFSGEPAYAGKPDATAVTTLEINNDGKEEFLLLYRDQGPLPFFARGYFSFGFAKQLDFAGGPLPVLQELMRGQQAGAAADLDGDGRQETIVVSHDGRVVVAWTGSLPPRRRLSLTVTPGRNSGAAVNVEALVRGVSLGARTVTAATPAFFGIQNPGQITLRWRKPDGTATEKRVPLLRSASVTLD